VSRDFSRSFATIRKIERMKEEADPDVTITHDTGCVPHWIRVNLLFKRMVAMWVSP
jgi:hypothetical protein